MTRQDRGETDGEVGRFRREGLEQKDRNIKTSRGKNKSDGGMRARSIQGCKRQANWLHPPFVTDMNLCGVHVPHL